MNLLFNSIKDAIRLKLYLSANGLQESFSESQGQFIYRFTGDTRKSEKRIGALVRFVMEMKRNEWIDKQLRETFKYESEVERGHILEISTQMFRGERPELTALAGEFDEEKEIGEAVRELIGYDGAVLFDSFLKFRLKMYFSKVADYVDVAIDEYKMEQEYQTFVQMLRDYLHKREHAMPVIHLCLDHEAAFYDEKICRLDKREIAGMLDRRLLSNHPVYVDSAVLAPLLSIAPKKIFLYTNEEEQALVRTLRNIFEERIAVFPPRYLHTLQKAYSGKT